MFVAPYLVLKLCFICEYELHILKTYELSDTKNCQVRHLINIYD